MCAVCYDVCGVVVLYMWIQGCAFRLWGAECAGCGLWGVGGVQYFGGSVFVCVGGAHAIGRAHAIVLLLLAAYGSLLAIPSRAPFHRLPVVVKGLRCFLVVAAVLLELLAPRQQPLEHHVERRTRAQRREVVS